MTSAQEKLRQMLEAMRERSEDPAFQANVRALEAGEQSPEEKRRGAWKRMGIPEEHWGFLLAGPREDEEAMRLVREFLGSDDRFLLLAGEAGRGKTLAACWGLTQKGGRFARAMDIAQAWGEEDEGWVADLRLAPLLVVDEMAREPLDPKGWAFSRLYDLLDRRQAALRKTVLVTNEGLDVFKARYCPDGKRDPLYDRIVNRGMVPRPLTGPSLRRPTP